MATGTKTTAITTTISEPNMRVLSVEIEGTAPYVQNKWSAKAKQAMRDAQAAGSAAKGKKTREPKDFDACYTAATYRTKNGEYGMPASAFRCAMISACRTAGVVMTRAKLAVFVEADGSDAEDNTPLVFIEGDPQPHEALVRNDSGVADIRIRPMWAPGWKARVMIRYDADMIAGEDVVNLIARVGMQVGIGEGRPDSKDSCGMGWGLFKVIRESVREWSAPV